MRSRRAKVKERGSKEIVITAGSTGTPAGTALKDRAVIKVEKNKEKETKEVRETARAKAKEEVIKGHVGLVANKDIRSTTVQKEEKEIIKEDGTKMVGDRVIKEKAEYGQQHGTHGRIIKVKKKCSSVIKQLHRSSQKMRRRQMLTKWFCHRNLINLGV